MKFLIAERMKYLIAERMKFLIVCGMTDCVEALPCKVWHDGIFTMIHSAYFNYYGNCNSRSIQGIQAKVAHFEDEYLKLKEITMILELALMKLRINEKSLQEEAIHCRKNLKTDESNIRRQCHVTCGADCVIRHTAISDLCCRLRILYLPS